MIQHYTVECVCVRTQRSKDVPKKTVSVGLLGDMLEVSYAAFITWGGRTWHQIAKTVL